MPASVGRVIVAACALFSVLSAAPAAAAEWKPWTFYSIGSLVTYQGPTYKCIQAHTSQPDWTPPIVPALWQKQSVRPRPTVRPRPRPTIRPTVRPRPRTQPTSRARSRPTATPSVRATSTPTPTARPTLTAGPTATPHFTATVTPTINPRPVPTGPPTAWRTAVTYSVNTLVTHGGTLYRAVSLHQSTLSTQPPNGTYWEVYTAPSAAVSSPRFVQLAEPSFSVTTGGSIIDGTWTIVVKDATTGLEQSLSDSIVSPAQPGPLTAASGSISVVWNLIPMKRGKIFFEVSVTGVGYQPSCNCYTSTTATARSLDMHVGIPFVMNPGGGTYCGTEVWSAFFMPWTPIDSLFAVTDYEIRFGPNAAGPFTTVVGPPTFVADYGASFELRDRSYEGGYLVVSTVGAPDVPDSNAAFVFFEPEC
jgi:hypothetical protein